VVHGAQDTVAQEDVEEDTVVQEEDMEVQDTEAQEDTVMASSGVNTKTCPMRTNSKRLSRDLWDSKRTRTRPCARTSQLNPSAKTRKFTLPSLPALKLATPTPPTAIPTPLTLSMRTLLSKTWHHKCQCNKLPRWLKTSSVRDNRIQSASRT